MTMEQLKRELGLLNMGEPTELGRRIHDEFATEIDFYMAAYMKRGYGLERLLEDVNRRFGKEEG